ncbi:MAG: hypothetical protein PHU17_01400 [Candidatus Pacebacteria bacterium]|nr:hypothetical protein [Candidatus Paceibacterota bacterium]MDD4074166.1 hypothetical protein [Candidatus Paceibacterota bacterium]
MTKKIEILGIEINAERTEKINMPDYKFYRIRSAEKADRQIESHNKRLFQ